MIRRLSLVSAAALAALSLGGSHAHGAALVDVRVDAPSSDGALLFADGSWSWRCTAPVCTVHAYPGHTLTVTAQSGAASAFQWWGGACRGTQASCSIAVGNGPVSASARFSKQRLWLPTYGGGTISASTAGYGCGNGCFDYATGQQVVLHAVAAQGWRATDWGGYCGTVGADHGCIVTMGHNIVVSATFEPVPTNTCPEHANCSPMTSVYTFSIQVTGQGSVTAPRMHDLASMYCSSWKVAQCAIDRPVEHWIYITASGVHFCRFFNFTHTSKSFGITARFG